MTDIKLSKRMQAVADMVTAGCVADIGCDHAFIAIYLRLKGIAANVIAMDVRKGPLDIARTNISLYGLSDYIDVRLSDGFDALKPGEADTAIIAGMGGLLMVDILKRGKTHTDNGIKLVLQPQSEPDKLRAYLYEIGYDIEDETFLLDEGKYYTVIRAVKSYGEEINNMYTSADDDGKVCILKKAELLYGPVLLKKSDKLLHRYIQEQLEKSRDLKEKLMAAPTPKGMLRIKELEEQEKVMLCALEYINN